VVENEKTKLKSHTNGMSTEDKLQHIIDELEDLSFAFPEGPIKHREAHEAWLKAKKAEEDFYVSLKTEIMKKGIAGIFAIIALILGLALTGATSDLISHLGKAP
jgi:hypothetical protein